MMCFNCGFISEALRGKTEYFNKFFKQNNKNISPEITEMK